MLQPMEEMEKLVIERNYLHPNAALQQLISSGGLRLFKKDSVADGIAQFDRH